MKNIKKLTAAILAVAMLVVCAGCGDQSWSYKTDNASLKAGVYIYNLMDGYYQAYDKVESPDEVKDILKEEVTESGDSPKSVEQYALDKADEKTLEMIAVEDLFNKYGLEFNESDFEASKSYVSGYWGSMKKSLESYGISEESFYYCMIGYSIKYSQVLEYLYGKNGDKALSDDDLIKWYKDKYTGYAYFSMSKSNTDADGNSVEKTDDEWKKAHTDFNNYVKMINNDKKDYKDVILKYTSDYELTSDPTSSGSYNKESSMLADEVKKALDGLKEGEAAFVQSDEDDQIYLVYKPVTDSIVDFLEKDEEKNTDTDSSAAVETSDTAEDTSSIYVYDLKTGYSHLSLLQEMKEDEYKDYLKEYANSINVQKNNAVVGKFGPKMFVSKDSD